MKNMLEKLVKRENWNADEDFSAYEYAGGNLDDAYQGGYDDGQSDLAHDILVWLDEQEREIRADERAKVLTELRPLVEAIDTAGNECACGLLPANSSDDCESCEARKKVGELRKAVGL